MNSIRLLPIVMVAASALLVFKLFGFISGDLYVFGNREAIAQEAEAEALAEGAEDGAEANPVVEATKTILDSNRPADAVAVQLDSKGNLQQLSDSTGIALTELEFLERLGERRKELDERESQLAVQEAIIRAAEIRLETRANELKQIEARISALVDKKEGQEEEKFKALVATYENMKAKDAARIFDRLDMIVLVRMVERINPRKMATIMAAMDSEKAEALTINLANPNLTELNQPANGGGNDDLPQIVGQ
ncbi:MotE family protein [Maritalea sp.]|uniref:MotE family protein n=1 Tax=Maritalea sp. TaxID=2003361 RepID=UPI0039E4A0D0